jgi:DNA adenine methylase
MPKRFERYWEPMIGGGALFCSLEPERATIGDANFDLVQFYRALKRYEAAGILSNAQHFLHDVSYKDLRYEFNLHRETWPGEMRAGALLALNRRCFNGLWRVNRDGQFNVPEGHDTSRLPSLDTLEAARRVLARTEIEHAGYDEALARARPGDFVYLDPPYDGTFDRYGPNAWSPGNHSQLFALAGAAASRGVKVLISQAATDLVRACVTRERFASVEISATQTIAASGKARGARAELIIWGGY